MVDISVKSWNRFIASNFLVATEVMGCLHEFEFEKHQIIVRLPKNEHADKTENSDNVANLVSYRSSENEKEPLTYQVIKIDVEVILPNTISVPEEALSNPPNQYKHFSADQQKAANAACNKLSEIAERAFLYWLEIIRWISGGALIGQPELSDHKSGWATYLRATQTNHRVWSSGHSIVIHRETEITKEHWEKAGTHLKNSSSTPMHIRFLHDSRASARNGLFEKAIIEVAMACEIFLRYSVLKLIPSSTPDEIKKYVEEANISKYANQFFKELIPESKKQEYREISNEIASLMSKRNGYLHMGVMQNADHVLCQRFIKTAEKLFDIQL